eukprot:scaffold47_cov112-Isochrysis_galbana.AAC.8
MPHGGASGGLPIAPRQFRASLTQLLNAERRIHPQLPGPILTCRHSSNRAPLFVLSCPGAMQTTPTAMTTAMTTTWRIPTRWMTRRPSSPPTPCRRCAARPQHRGPRRCARDRAPDCGEYTTSDWRLPAWAAPDVGVANATGCDPTPTAPLGVACASP